MTLYVLLTSRISRLPLLDAARACLDGGADVVQLREKDATDRHVLALGAELRKLADVYGALLIVNDRPDLAKLVDADGCHVGQDDLPLRAVRKVMGEGKLAGVSTHSVEQAREAKGADYVAVGPMYPTETKGYTQGVGPELARSARPLVDVPMVAIGGITPERVPDVLEAGADCVAVCSAVIADEDPEAAARRFRRAIDSARG